jgi:hypothetical protein
MSCEKVSTTQRMRGSLYPLSTSPQSFANVNLFGACRWSYGSNRVQIDADIKVLSEFLSYLQTDSTRTNLSISSLSPGQSASRTSRRCRSHIISLSNQLIVPLDYALRLKNLNFPLRLLVENEIVRLTVWSNPTNDAKRGADHVGTTERGMLEVNLANILHFCFTYTADIPRLRGQAHSVLYGRLIQRLPSM